MDFKLYLNNEEFRLTDRYEINEQVGQPTTSTFDILIQDSQTLPLTHTKVELKQDGVNIYLGYILTVNTPTFSSQYETYIAPIQVVSASTIFTRRLISDVWENKTTTQIVQDIFDNYLIEEGFTLGTIENFDRTFATYVASNLTMYDVLTYLADDVAAVADITATGVFNFISKSSFNNVDPPTKITGLKLSEAGQDLKTVQKITGAKAETSIKTYATVYAGEQSILLGYGISKEPSVTINGTLVEVGIQGADDESTTKTFLWKYGNNALTLNQNSTTHPVNGDTIAVAYQGSFDVEITQENEDLKNEISLISGTSGRIESVVIDTSITNLSDGESIAANLLTEKGVREQTIKLICEDLEKTTLLNTWTLDYPQLGIQGDFTIIERTITDFYDKVKVSLKLKNRGYYSRYGTVLNRNTKELNNLSVGTDSIVFKSSSINDTVNWSEGWTINQDLMAFTPGTTDIFSPVYFDGITPINKRQRTGERLIFTPGTTDIFSPVYFEGATPV